MVWRVMAVVVALAACIPYVPSLDNYFVQDDFGVVALLASKPAGYFPRWFVSTWMDGIWGYTPDEIRPFPAITYQLGALWGATSTLANHVINVAFHALNAVLVLSIARHAAGLAAVPAAGAALVFALLPMQTESVAWITGRVDSMPACLFLVSFLLFVRWRAEGRTWHYLWSVAFCFGALFSKQNTVILAPCLVAYDVLVRREPVSVSWRWLRPYAPFVVLTVAYLGLRYALFGEIARESMLTEQHARVFLSDLIVHLKRMVYGEPGVAMSGARLLGVLATVAVATAVYAAAVMGRSVRPWLGVASFFLVVWIGLSVAPTLVAGYASPRHMYLASVGWAVAVAMPLDVLWRYPGSTAVRGVGVALMVALLGAYAVQLQQEVALWDVRSEVSRRVVEDTERETQDAPPGTVVVIGAPRRSFDFAVPHALRPPYTKTDLPAHVRIISHSSLHCCPANLWEPYTRGALRGWIEDPSHPPVIVLHWHPTTGVMSRVDDTDEPFLRELVPLLLDTPDVAALDTALLDITNKLVAGRTSGRAAR